MGGYLHSTNPTGLNRRVSAALADLDRFENTKAYKDFRAQGLSPKAALAACKARDQQIEAKIAAFNADDSKTHRSNPDSREHYYARRPILAEDADYEIVGFSGVSAKWLSA